MKILTITTLIFAMSFASQATENHSQPTFCEWLGEAASAVAQNRDNGMDEYELIGKFLQEDKSYGEQSVVIPLIGRVYGVEQDMNPEEVAFAEKQRCEIAFVNIR